MPNIYITANGLDIRFKNALNSYNQIINVLKGKKVAIIPNAKLPSQDRTVATVVLKELEKHGIKGTIFDLDEHIASELSGYNAIYFSGGEPKYLMTAIYQNNYYESINEFISSGNIIIGQSAGAMIMSRKYGDTTTGEFLIQDDGFDFFDKIIIPHYENLAADLIAKLPEDTFNVKDTDMLIKIEKSML